MREVCRLFLLLILLANCGFAQELISDPHFQAGLKVKNPTQPPGRFVLRIIVRMHDINID